MSDATLAQGLYFALRRKVLFSSMASHYSMPRLEGRAREHALAKDSGFRIRMKSSVTGTLEWVGGDRAKAIRLYMCQREATLREELKAQGLFIQDADCPVQISGGYNTEAISVDTRIWSRHHHGEALVEVKWTRARLERALTFGKLSLPKLRAACKNGRWIRSGHAVKAALVGVLVVMPGSWALELANAAGPGATRFPVAAREAVKKRRGGKSLSGAEKRKRNAHLKSLDQIWRKTAGKQMGARHRAIYRKTTKGKAVRSSSNKAYYKAQSQG